MNGYCKRFAAAEIECRETPDVANGEWLIADRSYGATANLRCEPGFRSDSDSSLICSHDGSWINDTKCVGMSVCPSSPLPARLPFSSPACLSFNSLLYRLLFLSPACLSFNSLLYRLSCISVTCCGDYMRCFFIWELSPLTLQKFRMTCFSKMKEKEIHNESIGVEL